MSDNEVEDYGKHYSEGSFWKKLKDFAIQAGKEVVEKALILFYTLQEAGTPKWAKAVIIGALGYFIFPVDAIPDVIPAVGYADDLGVLVAALAAVAMFVTPRAKQRAKEKVKEWFGNKRQQS